VVGAAALAHRAAIAYISRDARCGGRQEASAMQSQNRFFHDVARVAAGAAGALSGVRGEIESRLRDQLERVLAGMELVSREEFEAVRTMAAKAREEQELLLRRVAALEARLAEAEKPDSIP
jgi:BMFP domain-containing protein YqiC